MNKKNKIRDPFFMKSEIVFNEVTMEELFNLKKYFNSLPLFIEKAKEFDDDAKEVDANGKDRKPRFFSSKKTNLIMKDLREVNSRIEDIEKIEC